MKVTSTIVAAIAVLALGSSAHAARAIDIHANNAGELARLCAANPNQGRGDAAINFCHGFAQGLVDTVHHYDSKAFCFPRPMPTRSETIGQFVQWVRAEPSREKLPADAALYRFLRERYPCGG